MKQCLRLLIATFLILASLVQLHAQSASSPTDNCQLIDNYLLELSKEKNFSGALLILKDGKKQLSKAYGWADKENRIAFTTNTLASIGSITKAFTAAAIMKLVEQGKLSTADPLSKFFPSIPADKAKISIHQLLTHSSGFHEFLEQDKGDYEKIETEAYLKRAFEEPLAFKPGEKAVYTNVGYSILGIIIEQVSGLDYETFLAKNLFEPIGIKAIGYHFPMGAQDTIAVGYQNGKRWGTHQSHFALAGGGPYWNLKANGGLEVSLNDMALWLNSFNDHSLLTKASIDAMFTSHIQEEGYQGGSFFGYGCNISKSRRNTKLISNGGSNGIYFAHILRLPEEGLVFYMVTNERAINASMVLPNVTQLYFQGKIEQDAVSNRPKFEHEQSRKIYEMLQKPSGDDIAKQLEQEQIRIEDDLILLEVGQVLMQEEKYFEALRLYQFYTKTFPKIVVAWNDLGDVFQALKNKPEAIKCYEKALQLRPENLRAKEALELLRK